MKTFRECTVEALRRKGYSEGHIKEITGYADRTTCTNIVGLVDNPELVEDSEGLIQKLMIFLDHPRDPDVVSSIDEHLKPI